MHKSIIRYFQRRIERFYRPNRWHIVLDLSLIAIIIVLIISFIAINLFHPNFDLTSWVTPRHAQIDLNNPPLVVDVRLEDRAIKLSDGLSLNIDIKNDGQAQITNFVVTLTPDSSDFIISKISTTSDDYANNLALSINGNKISLASITPGQEINAKLKIYFKEKNSISKKIILRANYEYYINNQPLKNSLLLSDVRVSSELQTQAMAYYNSPQGDQLGSGPMPPIVGLPTNLWIFFKTEANGDFKDFVMSAKLPKNVAFVDNTSLIAGNLNYNDGSRQVIWKVDEILSGLNDYRAGFEVQLTPSKDQLGTVALLLDNIQFQALDSFSGLYEKRSMPKIDTGLERDIINKDNGRVVIE